MEQKLHPSPKVEPDKRTEREGWMYNFDLEQNLRSRNYNMDEHMTKYSFLEHKYVQVFFL